MASKKTLPSISGLVASSRSSNLHLPPFFLTMTTSTDMDMVLCGEYRTRMAHLPSEMTPVLGSMCKNLEIVARSTLGPGTTSTSNSSFSP